MAQNKLRIVEGHNPKVSGDAAEEKKICTVLTTSRKAAVARRATTITQSRGYGILLLPTPEGLSLHAKHRWCGEWAAFAGKVSGCHDRARHVW